jgi:adenylate cyclase
VARTAWLEGRERAQLMDIFSRHVSTEVADALWQNRAALIDQGVFVPRPLVATVLFLDIRGFTTVFEQLPARARRAMVEPRPRGDDRRASCATTAWWRASSATRSWRYSARRCRGKARPRSRATPATRSIAALALRAALEALNHEFSAESLPQMRVRVGINTGSMTQCSVGTDRRMEFTLLGDAVNTASRLESYAMPDDGGVVRILAGQRTIELAGAGFSARPVGSILLKGKEVPVTLFQVEGRS